MATQSLANNNSPPTGQLIIMANPFKLFSESSSPQQRLRSLSDVAGSLLNVYLRSTGHGDARAWAEETWHSMLLGNDRIIAEEAALNQHEEVSGDAYYQEIQFLAGASEEAWIDPNDQLLGLFAVYQAQQGGPVRSLVQQSALLPKVIDVPEVVPIPVFPLIPVFPVADPDSGRRVLGIPVVAPRLDYSEEAGSVLADLTGDGVLDRIWHTEKGMVVARLNPVSGEYEVLPGALSYSGWFNVDQGPTYPVFVGRIAANLPAAVVARLPGGIFAWVYDAGRQDWVMLPGLISLRDDQGYNSLRYPVFLADITGDGLAELITRNSTTVDAYRYNGTTLSWEPLPGSLENLRDSAGYWDPKYWSTIQMADIDGDGRAEFLYRNAQDLKSLQYVVEQERWETMPTGHLPLSNELGWDEPRHYESIRYVDGVLHADGPFGHMAAVYDASIPGWTHPLSATSGPSAEALLFVRHQWQNNGDTWILMQTDVWQEPDGLVTEYLIPVRKTGVAVEQSQPEIPSAYAQFASVRHESFAGLDGQGNGTNLKLSESSLTWIEADMTGDGWDDLVYRTLEGVFVYAYQPEIGAFRSLPALLSAADDPELADASYAVLVGNITGGVQASVVARLSEGIVAWNYDSALDRWDRLPGSLGLLDANGFHHPAYPVFLGDVTGNGVMELVNRNCCSVETYCYEAESGRWIQLPGGFTNFSNKNGYDNAAYYETIRVADVTGDGKAEFMYRNSSQLITMTYSTNEGRWILLSGRINLSNALDWSMPEYYQSLRVHDGIFYGQGKYGHLAARLDPDSGRWNYLLAVAEPPTSDSMLFVRHRWMCDGKFWVLIQIESWQRPDGSVSQIETPLLRSAISCSQPEPAVPAIRQLVGTLEAFRAEKSETPDPSPLPAPDQPPNLFMDRVDGNLVVFWEDPHDRYLLESAPVVTGPWEESDLIVYAQFDETQNAWSTRYVIIVPVSSGAAFFRLRGADEPEVVLGRGEAMGARTGTGYHWWGHDGAGWVWLGSIPELGDRAYDRIFTADVTGNGRAEVLARGEDGVKIWNISSDQGMGIPMLGRIPLTDAEGWRDPVWSGSIQPADLDGDGKAEVIARASSGLKAWSYNPSIEAWYEWRRTVPWTDAEGWNANATSIVVGDVNGDGRDEVVGRSYYGIQVYHYDTQAETFVATASPDLSTSDIAGFGAPAYYNTLQVADLDGDGAGEVLIRGRNGLEVRKYDSANQTLGRVSLNTTLFADGGGWWKEQYWSTIQTADVNGDGHSEVIARDAKEVIIKEFLPQQRTFHNLQGTGNPQLGDDQGWGSPQYYSTIQTVDLDGDGRAEVVARSSEGLVAWTYNTATSIWSALPGVVAEFSDAMGGDLTSSYGSLGPIRVGEF